MKFYTYLWLREDGTPYYVGKGHGNRAYRHNHRERMRAPKESSNILVQHWSNEETAFAYERYMIDFYGRKDLGTGCLRNLTDGGGGHANPSIETRCKIGESTRKALSGRKLSEKARQKISIALCGRKLSEEHRCRLGHAARASVRPPHSEETRRKIGNAHRGCTRGPQTEEHRRKNGEAQRGRKHSEETKQKMRISALARWNRNGNI